jgi:hypothetical protein
MYPCSLNDGFEEQFSAVTMTAGVCHDSRIAMNRVTGRSTVRAGQRFIDPYRREFPEEPI